MQQYGMIDILKNIVCLKFGLYQIFYQESGMKAIKCNICDSTSSASEVRHTTPTPAPLCISCPLKLPHICVYFIMVSAI